MQKSGRYQLRSGFEVFRAFKQEFGYLDRIIVNAGVGNGRRIGKGNFEINRATAETNFISALAQCEAAIEILERKMQVIWW